MIQLNLGSHFRDGNTGTDPGFQEGEIQIHVISDMVRIRWSARRGGGGATSIFLTRRCEYGVRKQSHFGRIVVMKIHTLIGGIFVFY